MIEIRWRKPASGWRPGIARALVSLSIVATLLGGRPGPLLSQEGTTAARVGGAAIGFYSGALLGLAGSAVPCVQLFATRTCARIATTGGGVTAGIAGGLLGDADSGAVEDALRSAGFGALAGGVVGAVTRELVYYYDWFDALAFAALGAAIAPVAPGAALGLAAGGALGFGLYVVVPSFELTDAAALGGVGVAIGGIVDWALKAADARDRPGPTLSIELLTVRF